MSKRKKILTLAGFLLIPVLLFACTSVHQPNSGFLGDYSSLEKGQVFKQERIAGGVDLTKYQKIKVHSVEIDRFQNPYKEYSEAEIRTLAFELQTTLEKVLSKKYEILGEKDKPDKQTLVISPALVYATSPEWIINAATFWLIGFQFSKGSVAFEAKLSDGGTGREIAAVAEERKGGGGGADIKSLLIGGFFRFIHAEGAFTRWGKNFDKMTSPLTN